MGAPAVWASAGLAAAGPSTAGWSARPRLADGGALRVTISTQRLSAIRDRADSCRRSLVLNGRPSRPSTTTRDATDMSAQATSAGLAAPAAGPPTEARAPLTKAKTQASGGMAPAELRGVGAAGSMTAAQSASKSLAAWATRALQQVARVTAFHQVGGRLEGVQPGVDGRTRHLADILDVDTVDLVDLTDHQVEQTRVGQLDDELVYRPAAAAFQDVHSDQVAPDGAYAAGNRSERTRPIGQPDPHNIARHSCRLLGLSERNVSTGAPRC